MRVKNGYAEWGGKPFVFFPVRKIFFPNWGKIIARPISAPPHFRGNPLRLYLKIKLRVRPLPLRRPRIHLPPQTGYLQDITMKLQPSNSNFKP